MLGTLLYMLGPSALFISTAAMAAGCAVYAFLEKGFVRSLPVILPKEAESGVNADI